MNNSKEEISLKIIILLFMNSAVGSLVYLLTSHEKAIEEKRIENERNFECGKYCEFFLCNDGDIRRFQTVEDFFACAKAEQNCTEDCALNSSWAYINRNKIVTVLVLFAVFLNIIGIFTTDWPGIKTLNLTSSSTAQLKNCSFESETFETDSARVERENANNLAVSRAACLVIPPVPAEMDEVDELYKGRNGKENSGNNDPENDKPKDKPLPSQVTKSREITLVLKFRNQLAKSLSFHKSLAMDAAEK